MPHGQGHGREATGLGELTNKVKRTAWIAAGLVGMATAATAYGQAVQDNSVPAAGNLNLPSNPKVYGTVDPNVRRPTAIVNEYVITGTDVDQRMNLLIAANEMKLSPAEHEQLRQQILQQLVDETLQIQQAKSKDITVEPAQIDQSFNRLAQNFNKTPEQMKVYLRQIGSSERSLRRQVEAQMAWNRYLRNNVQVNVGDAEVKAILDRLKANKGTFEYHLKEIYRNATPDNGPQVASSLAAMIEEMKQGKHPFDYYAQFTESSTRASGGDLDWLNAAQLAQLPDAEQAAVQQMQVGQIAGPIEVPGGYSLLYLVDKRQVGMADPRDAKLSLRQLTITFPPGATQQTASARAAEFAKQIKTIKGCGGATKVAAEIGADVVDNDAVRIRDLPAALQDIMLKLQVGEATPPFGSVSEGVRTLVVCSREEATDGVLPDPSQVEDQLEQQRVNMRALQLMRDLRRDAVIEYR